ncbi:glycoside hydrolase family 2 protein [Paenibacillus sp. 598K]|uniref:glycoside hydrolase family 2 protein n=1 Tax=Paenibacillus sp. 598K TaxID=1117987 RepID=UPI000FFF39FC|nr:sugar-binding domain-containing protein [Paenibacillus sp. 598K]
MLMLNGDDWLIRSSDEETEAYRSTLPSVEEAGWIPAMVPGNIQADLETACELKPLWYGTGDERLVGVAQRDWWYSKQFDIPDTMAGKRIKLYFDGVDYASEIWVNDVRVGTNEGMFKRFSFDITELAKVGETNRVVVLLTRMPEEILPYLLGSDGKMSGEGTPYFFVEANNKARQVLKGLKSPANFSYDWGTNIWTLGIWRDVWLEATSEAAIEWTRVEAQLDPEYRQATIQVALEIDAAVGGEAVISYLLEGNGQQVRHQMKAVLAAGSNVVQGEFALANPALWWVHGYGEQPLYWLHAELHVNGTASDSTRARFGIREIRWEQVEGAPEDFPNPFRLVLNGVPIRTMGSNLVAPDLLYGRIGDRGRHFIEMARECNMNTLRQHGGQVVFPQSTYDAADELGILLLVDFPIANCVPENEPVFLANFEETLRNIVKQLRNHPSIIEWSGGNELEWYFKPGSDHAALRIQEKVTAEEDSRLFRATCPIHGSRHAPWDYNPDFHYHQFNQDIKDNFGEIPMMRYGEVGCQTPSNVEVWYRDIPLASQWPINEDDPALIRKNVVNAVFAKQFWLAQNVIERLFGELDSLEDTIKAGQFIGAEGVRYIADALRAKGKRLGGFTTWDYNEPWPNGAGSFMVDYDGRTLMKYHFIKQALAPIAIQMKYDSLLYDMFNGHEVELLLVSDALDEVRDLEWSWKARDRRGAIFAEGAGTARIAPHETVSLQTVNLLPPMRMRLGPMIVELALRNAEGELISERTYVFGPKGPQGALKGLLDSKLNDPEFGVPYVTTAISGAPVKVTELVITGQQHAIADGKEQLAITLANRGEVNALFLEAHPQLVYRTDLFVDNQFVSIPPGESRTITIKASLQPQDGLTLEQTGWLITAWNAPSLTVESAGSVLLSMGRKDATTRGYAGVPTATTDLAAVESIGEVAAGNEEVQTLDSNAAIEGTAKQVAASTPALAATGQSGAHAGRTVVAAAVWHKQGESATRFTFTAPSEAVGSVARLRIHTADQAPSGSLVRIVLNGEEQRLPLAAGLGIQESDPAHLAYPKTLVAVLPEGVIRDGENLLDIAAEQGWFTWDALDLTTS